jgi:peptide/nickel transport system substrate-binding protein
MNDPYTLDRRTLLRRAGALGSIAAFGGASGLLSACGSDSPSKSAAGAAASAGPGGKPVKGGTLRLAIIDTPVNMDPRDAQLYSSMQVYQNIFHKLVNVTPDFKIIPGLASSWQQEDGKTWTFDLVDNAVFHNDEPLTAKDVKFTLDTVGKHGNASFFAAFKSCEVLGDHKLRIHFNGTFGAVLPTLAAFGDIMNEKAAKSSNPKLKPVGCGPYKMTEWVQGDHVTLERWDKFFKADKPHLDKLVFRSVADDTVRLTGLQTGGTDWIQRVPLQRVTALDGSGDIAHTKASPYLPDVLLLNASKPPFDDRRVRQAIAWLVDRDEISKLVWFGQADPATEAVAKVNPFYSGVNPYEGGPDPDKAKALLQQAGVTDLRIVFAGTPGVPTQVRMGEVLKSQLAKGGVTMEIRNYSTAQWFDQLATKRYDLTVTYWSATLDPLHMYQGMAHSASPFNFSYLKSKTIDGLLDKFAYTPDEEDRKKVYPDLVKAVADEAAIIYLVNELQEYWTTPKVGGAAPLPSLEIRAEDMWLAS